MGISSSLEEMILNKDSVYPSIEELLPDLLLSRIPASLAEDMQHRYETLGPKYLTDNMSSDGRRINACMFNSSVQDALEEVVDAVFNVCVWIYKGTIVGHIEDNAYPCLMGLIEIYALLKASKEQDATAYSQVR